jgi:hypothetical protein
MAYKVGSTTVIDDSANIDWTRLTGKPTNGVTTGTNMMFNDVYANSGSGYYNTGYTGPVWRIDNANSMTRTWTRYYYNCYTPPANCNCNCYC